MKDAKTEITIAFTHRGPNGAGKEGDGQGMVERNPLPMFFLKKT